MGQPDVIEVSPDQSGPAGIMTPVLSRTVSPFAVDDTAHVQNEAIPERTFVRKAAILLALYLSLFVAALDQMITATAIPTISSHLHSASGYSWVGGAYLLANAAAGPLWAKTSDIWGRKPGLLGAVALFFVSSIIAAASASMSMLIAARALQGVAGGGIIQLVYIVISDVWSMRRRALILGSIETMWALASGVGPLLGGVFTQLATWRWIFWVNLPISGIAMVLILLFLDVHNPRTRLFDGVRAIDWFGTFSMLGVTLMILLGLNFGGVTFPWNSATVICLLVFGTLLIGFFLFSEIKLARYPLVPLTVFNGLSSTAVFLVGFAHGIVFIGAEYYLPLFFQSVHQASPIRSGVLILPLVLCETASGFSTGMLMDKTGRYREAIWVGTFLITLGTGLYIMITPHTPMSRILGFEVLGGLGAGFLFQSPIIAVQAVVSQADTAMATATFGFIRTTAAALSLVVGGVVFQNSMNKRVAHLGQLEGFPNWIIDALQNGQAAAHVDVVSKIDNLEWKGMVESAFASSLRNLWILYACVGGAGFVMSWFVVHVKLSHEHVETRTGIDNMTEKKRERNGQGAGA
ncbi:hypothetical protein K431DRAFT_283713 [Polychaeton citri CBS 116435]|uniref:Major facilitator superfamily (MFS) profile domain-containing protein n=1 Tax=Polychaeton citri CBS 116435 TaxID=1314669 RepID=A0A9P4QAU1_9PEZI|nr:hypothetical protein K431DRAFT_283713 [Polychaeton citri CBS 116435]